MSTEKIYNAVIKNLQNYHSNSSNNKVRHLDIGAGSGELIRKLKDKNINIISNACDYTDSLMQLTDQKVDIVNLNNQALPYQNESFDIVTATEIIEHLENPRNLLREINRVLKFGGIFILSTPNILNLNSRLRFLWFGFAELFGPLPIGRRAIESCAGHISPISYFYLYHGLNEANFSEITLGIDKIQRSGIVKLIFLFLPILAKDFLIKRKEIKKYHTIDETNINVVNQINSIKVLLGRTLIITAIKKEI